MSTPTVIFASRILLLAGLLAGFIFDWRRSVIADQIIQSQKDEIEMLRAACHIVEPQAAALKVSKTAFPAPPPRGVN